MNELITQYSTLFEYPNLDECFWEEVEKVSEAVKVEMMAAIEKLSPDQLTRIPLLHTKEGVRNTLSKDIISIVLELKNRFSFAVSSELTVNFFWGHGHHGARLAKDAESGEIFLDFNLLTLEGIARGYHSQYLFDANATLRHLISHEMYHFYSLHRFPKVMEKSKNIDALVNPDEYDLSKPEIAAELFDISELRQRPETDQRQRAANFEVADRWERTLDKRLKKVRRKNFFRNLTSLFRQKS